MAAQGLPGHAASVSPCVLAGSAETAAVRSALGGATLILADGREVLLAGIEIPTEGPGAELSHSLLRDWTQPATVELHPTSQGPDRYGRIAAQVFRPGGRTSAQQDLVEAGAARAGLRAGSPACAAALQAAERRARHARAGLWGGSHYVIGNAGRPKEVLAQRGRFSLVEGKVVSVRESGPVIYVNFGRRWSEDFTVTVLKRSERAFAAAGLDLKGLAGRSVRVRGVVEERGGPWIEASLPEQIEVAD